MSIIVQKEVTIQRNRCTFCDCSFAETHVNDIIRYLNRPIRYISLQLLLRYNSMSGIIIEICNTHSGLVLQAAIAELVFLVSDLHM